MKAMLNQLHYWKESFIFKKLKKTKSLETLGFLQSLFAHLQECYASSSLRLCLQKEKYLLPWSY